MTNILSVNYWNNFPTVEEISYNKLVIKVAREFSPGDWVIVEKKSQLDSKINTLYLYKSNQLHQYTGYRIAYVWANPNLPSRIYIAETPRLKLSFTQYANMVNFNRGQQTDLLNPTESTPPIGQPSLEFSLQAIERYNTFQDAQAAQFPEFE